MLGRAFQAGFLVALFVLSTGLGVVESTVLQQQNTVEHRSQSASGAVDVPTYRVGDKWVYETKFDVAQLLAQANVSASLNTLTGDTVNEVTDIFYETDDNGDTILAYEIEISGSFTSGNSGATLEGVTGRLNIDYDGIDILRARDLATVTSDFTLDVRFRPFNLGFLEQTLGIVTFDNTYSPAKERHDFPLRNGDQWYMEFEATTEVSGTSDYFDPSEFDAQEDENNSWQVVKNEAPSEDGDTPQYTGCDDSYKISEWNATGVNLGFNWYCPAVRGSVWNRIVNPAGFSIDWLLKTYDPADSNSVISSSSPGGRNTQIHVSTATTATLPDAIEQLSIEYSVAGSPSIPIKNTNLQLRYEIADTIINPTTDNNGQAQVSLNVSDEVDDTPASDDYTSNGVVVYDPVGDVVGATTIVQDLSVVGIDLVAQASSVIVERTRNGDTSTLGASIGYNALPGDVLSFSLPAQNRGVLSAPSTFMEIETPDGTVSRSSLPSIAPYSEARVLVDWSVPADMQIGTAQLTFTVDPDQNVTADANRSNNDASISVFIGRAPNASLVVDEGKYTFENITLNATQSFDIDGGDVDCRFEIESRAGLIDVIEAPDCWTQWNWSNSGSWSVKVLVVDEELDTDEMVVDVVVLNRAPTFNLTHPASVEVESPITLEAVDIEDIDTSSPTGQQVSISWPGLECDEGLTQPRCTFTPMFEGPMNITAVATDDDGTTTTLTSEVMVLNVAPTLSAPSLFKGGEEVMPDENGTWHLNEDEVALLRATASDTANDEGTVIIEWHPSLEDENWTISSIGIASSEAVSWNTSGMHTVQVRAIDADGASSEVQQAMVMIHNVPPTVTGLPGNTPVFENDVLNLTVVASDTASDLASLEVCWDLDAALDSNGDGVNDNDCELSGLSVAPSWDTRGVRMITVTVTDDDGAIAQQSMNVSVLNLPPTAVISEISVLDGLTEGDNLTLSGTNSVETAGDKENLVYAWDSSHLDTDLDGQNTGDIDFTGPTWTVEDLPAGTWTFTLTVTDDDGESTQAEIIVLVAEAPAEGILESITSTVGTTTAVIIGLLGIIIVGLVIFLLFTRQGATSAEDYSMFDQSQYATAKTMAPLPAAQPAAPAQAVQADPSATVAVAPMETAQAVNTGPPIPATGLPEGWTMEQWNYYGEQWLAANPPAPAPVQPIVSQTPPTPASAELQSLLDDLDF
ncbi:MAG: PKD domain-containing protein [Poseidonia sp.]